MATISNTSDHHFVPAKKSSGLTKKQFSQLTFLAIATIVFLTSFPMFGGALPAGHDIPFHLYRIQGLVDGLANGEFPVRMQTAQVLGFGYPVSICYGDLFLYIPALTTLLGLSLIDSYELFILMINAATAICSYFAFRRVFQSRSLAFTGCALWMFAPYRIIDLYLRAAIGEILSLVFLPMILLGIVEIFSHDLRRWSPHGWIWVALGITGIVYSHILSTVLLCLLIPFILIGGFIIRRDSRTIKQVILAFVASVLLSLAFIVPFLDFYGQDGLNVDDLTFQEKQEVLAEHALFPAQLFEFCPPIEGLSHRSNEGVTSDMGCHVGWGLLSGVVLWLAFTIIRKKSNRRSAFIAIGFAVLIAIVAFLFATTYLFPWKSTFPLFELLVTPLVSIQYPWRLLGIASFLLVILCLMAFMGLLRYNKKATHITMAVVIGLAAIEGGYAITSDYQNSTLIFELPSQEVATATNTYQYLGVGEGEYLPEGLTPKDLVEYDGSLPSKTGDVTFDDYQKVGTTITMHVDTSNNGGVVTLPLLYYPNYRLELLAGFEGGAKLVNGSDHFVTIEVDPRSSGLLKVYFEVPALWTISTYVSIVAFVLLILYCVTEPRFSQPRARATTRVKPVSRPTSRNYKRRVRQ